MSDEQQVQEAEAEPSLLEVRRCEVPGLVSPVDVSVREGPLVCVDGAGALVPALLVDGRASRLSVLGEEPRELLRRGRAGYCPRAVPVAASFTVRKALRTSARLIGLGEEEVQSALVRSGLSAVQKRRIGSLPLFQRRLLGVAHGICGAPELLLIEDLCSDLDDAASEVVAQAVLSVVSDKQFVVAGRSSCRAFRAIWASARSLLYEEANCLKGPVVPEDLVASSHWVTTLEHCDELADALREAGLSVCRTPNERSLFVEARAATVVHHAAACGAKIVSLTPWDHAPFVRGRATSAP